MGAKNRITPKVILNSELEDAYWAEHNLSDSISNVESNLTKEKRQYVE